MKSHGQFNLLIGSAKIMGKAAYSAPQSKIASAVLAARWKGNHPGADKGKPLETCVHGGF